MIKLLALDMDGTLLNDQKELTAPQIEAIHAAVEAGVKLVLCTGRMLTGVKPYFEQLGLAAEEEYVIVNNGCSTHKTNDWSLVDCAELSPQEIAYLAPFAQDTELQLTLFDEDHYFVVEEEANEFVEEDATVVFVEPTTISLQEATSGKHRIFQAMFVGPESAADDFEAKHSKELSQRFNGVRSQKTIFEILPPGISKASALQKLADKLGIDTQDIMAIGDGNNDIEMLELVGLSIAMGNANDHVKSFAKDTTACNNCNGVAKAIHKWILEN